MDLMTPEQAAALRAPFPPEVIGKLPRVYCKKCSNGTCGEHQKTRCTTCRQNITTAHLHLDYVGHAEITDRLLQVDPTWNWEPVAFDARGLPALDDNGALWIRLTVAGVTRMGYGDAQGKQGPNAIKEAIGDGIRNAAMRFGVGLDLWGATYKGDAEAERLAEEKQAEQRAQYAQTLRDDINKATDRAAFHAAWLRIGSAVQAERVDPEVGEGLFAYCKARATEVIPPAPAASEQAPTTEPPGPSAADPMAGSPHPKATPPTTKLIKRLYAAMSNARPELHRPENRTAKLDFFASVVGYPVTSTNDLSSEEIKLIIFELDDDGPTQEVSPI